MQFANYNEFRSAVLRMIDGDDVSTTFSLDTLDLLIALGESRVYRGLDGLQGLRASTMQAPLTGSTTGNALTLPADVIELESVWFDPARPLEAVSELEIRSKAAWNHGGDVRQYAQSGATLIFGPDAADGSTIGGRYFQRPADIKTGGLHATFNRYPELYLFGALSESAPFLGEDARLPMWQKLFRDWLQSANTTERNMAYAGGRLRQKVR